MAALAVNDIYRVNIYCLCGSQTAITALYYRISAVGGGATDQDLANIMDSTWDDAYKAQMTTDSSYRGVGVQRRIPTPTTVMVFANAGAGAGTKAAPVLPKQICGVITKRTGFAGRKYRGRIYIPFPGEVDSEGTQGRPTAAYQAALAALAPSFAANVVDAVGPETLTAEPGLFRAVNSEFNPLTSCVARPYWGTQRRRGDFGPVNPSPI